MITYKISKTAPNEMTDLLGPDNSERTDIYPGVQVSYYDDQDPDEFVVATQSFYYRPGSAIEKEEDLQPFITETIAKLNGDS